MSTYEEKRLRRLATLAPDSECLRLLIENATPVPWTPVEHGSGPAAFTVETDDGTVVVEVHDSDDHPASLEVAAADARLIALAPALAAEVLRLRAERDALRGIVVRLAGDDGMYSDDYGMRCLCGLKRDHDDGCLRAEAQALLGGER